MAGKPTCQFVGQFVTNFFLFRNVLVSKAFQHTFQVLANILQDGAPITSRQKKVCCEIWREETDGEVEGTKGGVSMSAREKEREREREKDRRREREGGRDRQRKRDRERGGRDRKILRDRETTYLNLSENSNIMTK